MRTRRMNRPGSTLARPAVALVLAVLAACGAVASFAAIGSAASETHGRAASAVQPAKKTPVPKGQVRCPASAPALAVCITVPAHCPPIEKPCPEVIADPTEDLATEQSVFIQLEHFYGSTAVAQVQYCQDSHALSSSWHPLCVVEPIGELPFPTVTLHPYPSTGEVNYSFQVLYVAKGSTPLQGEVPGTSQHGQFLCNAQDPCSIDVTDPYLGPHGGPNATTPDPENTAVIPVTFAASQPGCPRANFIDTESEYGLDSLLTTTALNSCVGKAPVAAFDTDVDGLAAVDSFVEGNSPIAFTDSPSDPAQQQALATIKGQYAVIPIALSANVYAFQAIAQGQEGFPDSNFLLTPNMVAGLVTNEYNAAYSSDMGTCSWLHGSARHCALVPELNPVPGFEVPLEYGSYVRGDTASTTYELFQWLCGAPKVAFSIGKHSVTEPETAAQVLATAYVNNGLPMPKHCPAATDSFPLFQKAVPNFSTAINPLDQVSKLESFVPPPQDSTQVPHAGFSPMSWPDARTYGLDVAALQNAAGDFVLPSVSSIEAAAATMTVAPDGVYTPDYKAKVADAYPMPDVWYAVVSTKAQSQQAVTAERTLLDDILSVSGGKLSSLLPVGYAPLPKTMYESALAAVTKDITTTGPSTTPSVPTTTAPPTTLAPTTTTLAPVTPTTVARAGGHHGSTKTPTTTVPTTPKSKPPEKLPTQLASFALVGHSDLLLPALLACLLAAGVIFGPALVVLGRRRTRRAGGGNGS